MGPLIVTAITNRLGDSLILLSIGYILIFGKLNLANVVLVLVGFRYIDSCRHYPELSNGLPFTDM